jgi:hypothetical protein
MIAEGVRMKIALVFLALLGLVVLGLPFSISGDASLTGAVQSFMAYGLTATGFLLALLTIFLSRSLADELVGRHIFLIVTKPIPRWQFMLGKWLGIMALNGAFLAFAGISIYGMVHYLRRYHPPQDPVYDPTELAQEVLVARHALKTELPDFFKPAESEFQQNVEEGLYANVPNFDTQKEKERLRKKHEARWRVVGPLEVREFNFRSVLCERSPQREIQLRYKTDVSQYPGDEVFRAVWRFGDPRKGTPAYNVPVRHIVGRRHTVRVPADVIAEDHSVHVEFYNQNPFPGERQYGNVIEFRSSSEVELLFVVGSFEWNLVRLLTIMFCKLMFLAAVGLLMTSVFSFPVACFASLTVYVLAGARSFISDALDFASDDSAALFSSVKEFLIRSITLVTDVLWRVIPDFPRYDAVETLVNGRNVSLVWVLQAIADLALLKTALIIGLAMLLFQRREVAEVSL